ncbi:MAG: DUF975 family protein [Angelakisella sp.]
MKLRRIMKREAQSALTGNRGSAVVLIIICFIVSMIINLVDAAALQLLGYEFTMSTLDTFTYSSNFFYSIPAMTVSIITWLVRLVLVVPLGYGVLNWHLELTDRRKQGVLSIFWPYESKAAFRGVLLSLNIAIKTLLAAMLLLVLPVVVLLAGDMAGLNAPLSMTLVYSGIVLMVVAVALLWAFCQRFAIAPILICEKYQLTVHQAIKQSVQFTKGHRWELVRFELSFLPWMLPLLGAGGMLSFSLAFDTRSIMPLVWMWVFGLVAIATYLLVAPYYTMARVMYARYLYEYGLWQQKGTDPVQPTSWEQPEEPIAPPVNSTYVGDEADTSEEPMEPSEMSSNDEQPPSDYL